MSTTDQLDLGAEVSRPRGNMKPSGESQRGDKQGRRSFASVIRGFEVVKRKYFFIWFVCTVNALPSVELVSRAATLPLIPFQTFGAISCFLVHEPHSRLLNYS